MAAVCLKHEHLLEEFSRRVIHVLTEQSDKSIPMSKFTTAYEELCNHELRVQNFGFASLEDMLHAVSPVVKVLKTFIPCFIFIKLKKFCSFSFSNPLNPPRRELTFVFSQERNLPFRFGIPVSPLVTVAATGCISP